MFDSTVWQEVNTEIVRGTECDVKMTSEFQDIYRQHEDNKVCSFYYTELL